MCFRLRVHTATIIYSCHKKAQSGECIAAAKLVGIRSITLLIVESEKNVSNELITCQYDITSA